MNIKSPPPRFEASEPIKPGFIYMIQQDSKKKIVTAESLPKLHLTGKWKVKQQWIRECQK